MNEAAKEWLIVRSGLAVVFFLIVVGVWTPSLGKSPAPPQSPLSSSLDAPTVPSEWTSSERWAWNQVAAGRPADFDARFGTTEGSGRKSDDRFADPRRKLSAGFLRTVLTPEGLGRAVPRVGVRIRGAVFDTTVDVRDAVLTRPLEISDSLFAGELVLNRLRTRTSVDVRWLAIPARDMARFRKDWWQPWHARCEVGSHHVENSRCRRRP